jgi:hypothetical protein
MKKLFFSMLVVLVYAQVGLAQGSYQQLLNRYVGERKMTLQWLDTSPTQKCKPGKTVISQEDGEMALRIKGEQRKDANNYVKIEGTIEPVSMTEFKFTGRIVSRVSYLYNGEECVKEGTYTFKKHQGRAFYRLQEKTNCDGSAVDYVDIY